MAVHAFGADVIISETILFLPCEDSISLADSLNKIRWNFERSMFIASFSLCFLAQSLAGISNDTRIQWCLRRIISDADWRAASPSQAIRSRPSNCPSRAPYPCLHFPSCGIRIKLLSFESSRQALSKKGSCPKRRDILIVADRTLRSDLEGSPTMCPSLYPLKLNQKVMHLDLNLSVAFAAAFWFAYRRPAEVL
jgi:hypothetical protein